MREKESKREISPFITSTDYVLIEFVIAELDYKHVRQQKDLVLEKLENALKSGADPDAEKKVGSLSTLCLSVSLSLDSLSLPVS